MCVRGVLLTYKPGFPGRIRASGKTLSDRFLAGLMPDRKHFGKTCAENSLLPCPAMVF
jgi:hypothetical protein